MDRPELEFAERITIWNSPDQLEYELTREVLHAHNEHAASGAGSSIQRVGNRRYECDNVVIEVFTVVATGADGTEVAAPSVLFNTLDAEGRICRIDAYMDAAGMARLPSLDGGGTPDGAGPAIAESRARGRRTYPGHDE
jgi:hypothetical protein